LNILTKISKTKFSRIDFLSYILYQNIFYSYKTNRYCEKWIEKC